MSSGVVTIPLTIENELDAEEVWAVAYGPLAVHRAYGGFGWVVTHRRSGNSLGKRPFRTYAQAKEYCLRLLVEDLDWDFDGWLMPKRTRRIARKLKRWVEERHNLIESA